jgi:hypothetical protein
MKLGKMVQHLFRENTFWLEVKFKITLEHIIQTVKGQDNYGNRIFF